MYQKICHTFISRAKTFLRVYQAELLFNKFNLIKMIQNFVQDPSSIKLVNLNEDLNHFILQTGFSVFL